MARRRKRQNWQQIALLGGGAAFVLWLMRSGRSEAAPPSLSSLPFGPATPVTSGGPSQVGILAAGATTVAAKPQQTAVQRLGGALERLTQVVQAGGPKTPATALSAAEQQTVLDAARERVASNTATAQRLRGATNIQGIHRPTVRAPAQGALERALSRKQTPAQGKATSPPNTLRGALERLASLGHIRTARPLTVTAQQEVIDAAKERVVSNTEAAQRFRRATNIQGISKPPPPKVVSTVVRGVQQAVTRSTSRTLGGAPAGSLRATLAPGGDKPKPPPPKKVVQAVKKVVKDVRPVIVTHAKAKKVPRYYSDGF